jgi:hypothetical protein
VNWLRTETGRLTAQACQTHEAALRAREQQFLGGKQSLDRLNLHVKDIFVLSDLTDGDGQPAAVKLEAASVAAVSLEAAAAVKLEAAAAIRLEAAAVAAVAKPCHEMAKSGVEEEQPVVAELRNCSLSLLQHQLENLGTPQLSRSYRAYIFHIHSAKIFTRVSIIEGLNIR